MGIIVVVAVAIGLSLNNNSIKDSSLKLVESSKNAAN